MTIREYITQKFRAFNLTDADILDISGCVNPEDTYLPSENATEAGKAMVSLLEGILLSPIMNSVNENGFSVSWDYSKAGQYYMWLCRKYGIDPNTDVVAALGLSTISDKSDIW